MQDKEREIRVEKYGTDQWVDMITNVDKSLLLRPIISDVPRFSRLFHCFSYK